MDRGSVERVTRTAGGSMLRTRVARHGRGSPPGSEGRIAPVLAGVLPALPAGRAFAGVRGLLDHAHRFSLHPAPAGSLNEGSESSACPRVSMTQVTHRCRNGGCSYGA